MKYNYDTQAKKAQKEIQKKVRKYCKYRYDDPETNQQDMCFLFGGNLNCGQHCFAIDSPYSHIENGHSICKTYNALIPQNVKTTNSRQRFCACCKKPYIPTGNRQKFCVDCSKFKNKQADARRHREYRNRKQKQQQIVAV